MDVIAGMRTTGRDLRGPASDLVELDGANGLRHTAIVFHPRHMNHSAINDALTVVRDYLGSPMVTGMVELADVDEAAGAYVYPTGQCWSVAEVIRLLADMGESGGVRAGLELMFACGQILVEAADTGEAEGVYSHGGLTPWRVMLRKDGQVLVVGYALPQVEILEFHADPEQVPREDSFRYCPPERMEAAAEDISSDLFGLTLIAFELITGKPVYDGLVDDIRQQAARGEGSRRLFRLRDALTPSVRELLGQALKPSTAHRFPSGDDFLDAVRAALGGADVTGPSLMDVMARVAGHAQRTGARPESASTMMGTAEDFRKLLDDEEDEPADGGAQRAAWAPPPRRPGRRAARRTVEEPEAEAAPGAEPAVDEDAGKGRPAARKPRRARRTSESGDADLMASLRRSRLGSDAPGPEGPESGGKSRRVSAVGRTSRRAGRDGPPESGPASTGRPDPSELVRRIRMSGETAPASAPASVEPLAEAPTGAGRRPTRRTTRGGSLPVTTGPPLERSPPVDEDDVSLSLPLPDPPPVEAAPADAPASSGSARPKKAAKRPAKASKAGAKDPRPAVKAASPSPKKIRSSTKSTKSTKSAKSSPRSARPSAKQAKSVSSPSGPTPREAPLDQTMVSVKPKARRASVPAVAEPSIPDAAAGIPGAAQFTSAASLGRAPDPIAGGTKGARTQRLALRRGADAPPLRLKVAGAQPLGEVLANLIGTVLPVRTDLTGRISGWYRLESGEERLPATMPAKEAPSGELSIVYVPNTLVHADIQVDGAPAPMRFVSPIGTAVPVVSLVDHLCAWMGLPAGTWTLHRDGAPLPAFLILDDLSPAADQLISLRLVREGT